MTTTATSTPGHASPAQPGSHDRAPHHLLPPAWRNPINRILNLALYLLSCFMIGTGLILWLRLPPMQGRHRGGAAEALFGMTRHEWGDWHLFAGLALVALGVVHLLMNWTWMRKIAAGAHGWRLWAGLGAGLVIIAVLGLVPLN
jgi:hypothetical protein